MSEIETVIARVVTSTARALAHPIVNAVDHRETDGESVLVRATVVMEVVANEAEDRIRDQNRDRDLILEIVLQVRFDKINRRPQETDRDRGVEVYPMEMLAAIDPCHRLLDVDLLEGNSLYMHPNQKWLSMMFINICYS